MDGVQRIAYNNIKACFENTSCEWYNCIQDGCPEYIPETRVEAEEIIYEEAINNLYRKGYCGSNKAPREMRFAGEIFIRQTIKDLFDTDQDGDIGVIAEVRHW